MCVLNTPLLVDEREKERKSECERERDRKKETKRQKEKERLKKKGDIVQRCMTERD